MVYFVNGGNSGVGTPYIGETVADATAALTLLRTEILASGEGWVIGDVDDIGGTGQFSVDGTGANDNKLRVLFTRGTRATSGFADEYISVRVRDLDATGALTSAILTNYSPDDFHRVQLSSAGSNLLYAAIYEDCINLMAIPSSGFATGLHIGMCQRIDETDKTAMYIGYTVYSGYVSNSTDLINTNTGTLCGWYSTFSAVHPGTNAQWYRVSEPYADSGLMNINEFSSTGSVQMQGLDVNSLPSVLLTNTFMTTASADNVNFGSHLGRANAYQGKPLLLPYVVVEGRDDASNTGWTIDQATYAKGVIRDVVTGMGYMSAGAQWETNNSETYISTGASGWLAFRVA